MSGHRKWRELRGEMRENPARLDGFRQAIAASMWLPELRGGHGLTQSEVARRLDVSQSCISQIENETDVHLSTLSAYISALGGQLRLTAEFPDRPPVDLTRTPRLEDEPASPADPQGSSDLAPVAPTRGA